MSGKDEDAEFVLENDAFQWNRTFWSLGEIQVQSISEPGDLSAFLQILVERNTSAREANARLRTDNERLKSSHAELTTKLEDMIRVKVTFEKEIYKRFLHLLNAKKAKIREIRGKLNSGVNKFDTVTDESEDSDGKSSSKKHKAKHEARADTVQITKRKTEDVSMSEAVASTSKDLKKARISKDDETPDMAIGSEESECEIELKVDDEASQRLTSVSDKLTFVEEDSEEDLF